MCGIVGFLNNDKNIRLEQEVLETMCTVIHHRGPDDGGVKIFGNVGIGMRRLSIIDVAGGKQPIHNEDKSIWIVFNGEIYNYQELRKNLIKRGHKFYTNTDTETIVHLYEDFGSKCVTYLRGMFAFAIWDNHNERLFLARDRMGIKPLYYLDDSQRFIFGSELKSILVAPKVTKKIKPQALVNYFAYGYVPDPDTIFEGIFKLPPGNCLTYKKGKKEIRPYWELKFSARKEKPEQYYIERISDLLAESVKMRLISEVPLGAFLSGGVDSSLVVGLMARQMTEPVKTFSVGFEESSFSELKYSKKISKYFGTDHHEEIVNPNSEYILTNLVKQFDEPFADSSAVPTYYVSKVTRNHVTVALSGDGGDEMFGGYDRYLESSFLNFVSAVPYAARKYGLQYLTKLLPEWFPGINTIRHLSVDDNERYIRYISKGVSTIYNNIFSPEMLNNNSLSNPALVMREHLKKVRNKDKIIRRRYLDTQTYLPGDILTKVDRTSMLVSLEVRVPLLDHKLIEFVATIPSELIIKGMTTKYLLKKVAEKILPKDIIYRKKMGFAIPINKWIKSEWSDVCRDLVSSDRALSRRNFNPEFIKRIMFEHTWGRRDHSYLIWTLMILELWYREMID
jgi:asparagine synthase (glutamine-hydrolysing)